MLVGHDRNGRGSTGTAFRANVLSSHMPVPGYDPEDLDDALRTRLEARSAADLLSAEELAAYESDEDLLEALDAETIAALLEED